MNLIAQQRHNMKLSFSKILHFKIPDTTIWIFKYLIGCCLIMLTTCIDPYNFSSEKQEKEFLVVDGFISNEEGQYTVTLQRSSNFILKSHTYNGFRKDQGFNRPESKASVKIMDNLGNEIILLETESNSGIYKSTVSSTQYGILGNKYHISITTQNGEQYQSKPEILNSPANINNLYVRIENHNTLNSKENYIESVEGLQYYTDISVDDDGHYMLDFDETYIMEEAFDSTVRCYVTNKKNLNFSLIQSSDFNTKKIKNISLNFVKPGYKYNIKYSYNLKLYTISNEAYQFFKLIGNQLNTTGTIFDPTPAQITGNISNVNNPNETVIGYFGVYGMDSKRIFVSPNNLPRSFKKGQLNACFVVCPPLSTDCPPPYCNDCSLFPGSSKIRPDFWE